MTALIAQYGLLIVVLVIFAGEIGLPTLVPGEVALLAAGNMIVHSVPMLILSILLLGAVDLLATTTIHSISRTGGNRLLVRAMRMVSRQGKSPEERLAYCRRRLGGYDPAVVFVTRLIPMFRLYASIASGLIRVRFRHFLIGAGAAAWLWAAIPLTGGYVLRSQVGNVATRYPALMPYVVAGSVGVTLVLLLGGWLRHAGTREAALRRVRFILSMVAATGALTRVFTFVLHEHGLAGHRLAASVPTSLSVLLCFAGLAGLGLLWVAGHDLHVICTRHRRPGFGTVSGLAWIALVTMLTTALAAAGSTAI
ncbi:MAG TPA: VTT domain-containing protein [Chloroflexota bacterium]|nr:VTT domain-containing protein [Chloroflexota bacterium]